MTKALANADCDNIDNRNYHDDSDYFDDDDDYD